MAGRGEGAVDLARLRLSAEEKRTGAGGRRVALAAAGLAALAVGLVGLAVAASRGRDAEEAAGRPAQAAGRPAVAGAPAPRETDGEVSAGGYVEARRAASLLPGRDGIVALVHVELGQRVARGDLLLELEHQTDAAEVEMARAELELARQRRSAVRSGSRREEVVAAGAEAEAAEASWEEVRRDRERLESLAPRGAVTEAEVERARQRARAAEARVTALRAREGLLRRGSRASDVLASEAEVDRAEAALRRAEARLGLALLRAPFDGTVVEVAVRPGEAVSLQNGRGSVVLADLSELWVRVDVPEARVGRVRLGAAAEVVVDALGQGRLAGRVVEVSPMADRQSNTVEVAVRIDDPPPLLRPNTSARVRIAGGGSDP